MFKRVEVFKILKNGAVKTFAEFDHIVKVRVNVPGAELYDNDKEYFIFSDNEFIEDEMFFCITYRAVGKIETCCYSTKKYCFIPFISSTL